MNYKNTINNLQNDHEVPIATVLPKSVFSFSLETLLIFVLDRTLNSLRQLL